MLLIRICFLIIFFLCFFFSLPIIIKYFVLFYILYHTRTHTHTLREEKRPGILPTQHKVRGWGRQQRQRNCSCIIPFLFFFIPPTNTNPTTHWDPIWQQKRADNSSYVLYNTYQRRHIMLSQNLFLSCPFLSFFFLYFKITQRQTPCDIVSWLLSLLIIHYYYVQVLRMLLFSWAVPVKEESSMLLVVIVIIVVSNGSLFLLVLWRMGHEHHGTITINTD